MPQVFYRKKFSYYLGEQRAIDDIVTFFTASIPPSPTGTPNPTPTPTSTPIVTTPTPTPSPTTTLTPSPTTTLTPSPTSTLPTTPTPTPSPTTTLTPSPTTTLTATPTTTPTPTTTLTPTPTLTPTATEPAGFKLQAENSDFIQAENGDNINIEHAAPPSPLDPDAEAYLTAVVSAGGTVTSPMSGATNNLFLALKSNGLYSKMKAFYPVLGGVEASHAINGNLNTSFNLTFNNGFTHNISGFTGTDYATSYAETNYVPSTEHTGNTMSMGMFTNAVDLSNASGDFYMMGAYTAQDRFLSWDYTYAGLPNVFFSGKYLDNTATSQIQVSATTNWIGFVQLGGDGTTKYITQNRDGVDYIASAAQDGTTLPNQSIYLSNLNVLGGPYKNQGSRVAFAYMGDYLTTGETTTLSSIINAFQTSLGRNTY